MVVHEEGMLMVVLEVKGCQDDLMEFIQGGVGADLNMPVATGSKGYADHIALHNLHPSFYRRVFETLHS